MKCELFHEILERALNDRRDGRKAGKTIPMDELTTLAERIALRDHCQQCLDCRSIILEVLMRRIESGKFNQKSFQEGIEQGLKDNELYARDRE